MRIVSIKSTKKVNLGNYESLEFGAEAILEEGEKPSEASAKLMKFIDWSVNQQTREAKRIQLETELKTGKLDAKEMEKRTKWLTQNKELNSFIESEY